jgi:hypothetical protein
MPMKMIQQFRLLLLLLLLLLDISSMMILSIVFDYIAEAAAE